MRRERRSEREETGKRRVRFIRNVIEMPGFEFHRDSTSGTLSRRPSRSRNLEKIKSILWRIFFCDRSVKSILRCLGQKYFEAVEAKIIWSCFLFKIIFGRFHFTQNSWVQLCSSHKGGQTWLRNLWSYTELWIPDTISSDSLDQFEVTSDELTNQVIFINL